MARIPSMLRPALHHTSREAVIGLQSALDLDTAWSHCLQLVREHDVGLRSCSLMYNIVNFEPASGKHHVDSPRKPGYRPPTSLTVSGPFLERHPQVRLYTYSQIVKEDPDARRRRAEQETDPEWDEFVHLAFWNGQQPEAVFSITRAPGQPHISASDRAFLEYLHPMLEASLKRIRALGAEQARRQAYEAFLGGMPVATLLTAADGSLLFATDAGHKACERWNRALARDGAAEHPLALPQNLVQMYARSAQGREGQSLRLRHPQRPGLSVTVERGARAGYVITLNEDAVATAQEPAPLSALALQALQKLSPSERRVAQLAAQGLSNVEIGAQLCRSRRTIEFQLNAVYRKLELKRRAQLVRLFG